MKPANLREDRKDRRFRRNQSGKRKFVVVIRERGGETLPGVFKSEGHALSWIKRHLAARRRSVSTNWAKSYFSRLRRGEAGHHHHISGPYLLRFAQESAWREDNRRVPNGEQVRRVAKLAIKRGKSVDFNGYWQRHVKSDT